MTAENDCITDLIRNALPQALRDDPALAQALERVAQLEEAQVRAGQERRFLERAPREGLLYPGDALKLEDVTGALGDEAGLDRLFRDLRARRPYLFSKPPAAPEKLASRKPENEGIRQAWRGGLTRQVQIARDALRRR